MKKLFGNSVKAYRTQLGLSQEELAERADLHRTYVSDIERGARNVSLQNIEKLANALEVSISALFPHSDLQPGKNRTRGVQVQGEDFVNILLVEDNIDDAEMTLRAFKKARLTNRSHLVRDGAEALEYIFCRGQYAGRDSTAHPQVILLDLNLPKVSGVEVLRCLKSDKRTRKIPVVVLTASQKDRDMVECQRLGADSYIVKPVDFTSLSQATPHLNLDWALLKPLETNKRRVRM